MLKPARVVIRVHLVLMKTSQQFPILLLLLLTRLPTLHAAEAPLKFADPRPQRYELTARASEIDPRTRPHPEIDFVFEKDGKPADVEHASVDTRVPPQGKLVIWLMGYSAPLFERVNSYGLHAIRVHYANGWFGQFGKEPPPADDKFLGKIRLEAATGEDFSDVVNIPKPDGMMERALQFVKWPDEGESARSLGVFPHRRPAGVALGSRDHLRQFARLDHCGAVCQTPACGPGGDVLRAARSIRDVAGATLGHTSEPLLRLQSRAR
jgi:hypothetical protein